VSVTAFIRPDDWNFPLLLHVLGAMVLVAALTLAACALLLAWRDGSASLVRLGFRSLLLGVLPAWLLMRVGSEWIVSKEKLEDAKLDWVDIGYMTADTGFVLILAATVLAGIAMRRLTRGDAAGGFSRSSAVLVSLLIVIYLVATWAMTTKPV
jgi:hypothetical protein